MNLYYPPWPVFVVDISTTTQLIFRTSNVLYLKILNFSHVHYSLTLLSFNLFVYIYSITYSSEANLFEHYSCESRFLINPKSILKILKNAIVDQFEQCRKKTTRIMCRWKAFINLLYTEIKILKTFQVSNHKFKKPNDTIFITETIPWNRTVFYHYTFYYVN